MAHQTRIESTNPQTRSHSDPGVGAVPELLALPDRNLLLEGVDQFAAGGERFGAVRCGGRHYDRQVADGQITGAVYCGQDGAGVRGGDRDRKSTRLNSSHVEISYAVFCLKKKKGLRKTPHLPSSP